MSYVIDWRLLAESCVETSVLPSKSKQVPDVPELGLFFALAYLAQGMSSQFGLIAQPVQYLLMKGMHFTAADVSMVAALMMVPWLLKPVYGVLFDTVPFYGYRRKSYLLAAHAVAFLGLLLLVCGLPPAVGLVGLLLVAFAMAAATALMLGLAAEAGETNGKTRDYISAQSFYYYCGNIAAVLGAGFVCQHFAPQPAVQLTAAIACIPVIVIGILCLRMVKETRTELCLAAIKDNLRSVAAAARSSSLWLVLLLAFCWNFTPSFSVPLYFHESNTLMFPQSLIGQLTAWFALGMMIGAVVYRDLLKRIDVQLRVYAIAVLWVLSILSYLMLSEPATAFFIEFFHGVTNTLEILCLYELAAAHCKGSSGVSVMALLLAARNLANEAATIAGGNLFSHVFHDSYSPLVIVGVLGPLVSLLLIPYIVRHQQASALNSQLSVSPKLA